METSDFGEHATGRLAPTVNGHLAFVPNDLPPAVRWTSDLVTCVAEAERALGRLGGVGQDMPNPHLLIRPFMRREAVLSSQIEGTQTSMPQLLLFEVNEKTEQDVPDVREVFNYVRALEHGLKRHKELPLSLRLVREMHGILMKGVRGEDKLPGEFRRDQNWIGLEGTEIENARFVPPPKPEMDRALDALEKYLHAPSDLPPVVRLALVHYQFEAIHPFVDGNGRIGRLLISVMLCLEDILPMPLLYLSAHFQRTRPEYYEQLLRVSQRGTWEDWIAYFARGVTGEATDAIERARRLKDLQVKYVAAIRTPRTSALVTRLIEELFNHPMVTVGLVAKVLGVTPPAAQLHIDRLVQGGILREATGRKRNRIFVAEGIIRSIYEPSFRRSDLKASTE